MEDVAVIRDLITTQRKTLGEQDSGETRRDEEKWKHLDAEMIGGKKIV